MSSENQSTAATTLELIEVEGDLFSSSDSLCHCVSEDLSMSKGIALLFKNKYGKVEELRRQGAQPGGLAVLKLPSMRDTDDDRHGTKDKDNNRFAYYLVTKTKYYLKPTYQTLESSLTLMKNHMVANDVHRLSMPLIGCGLDRLQWDRVKNIINQVFNGLDIKITVYKLPASASDAGTSTRGRSRGGNKKRGSRGGNKRGPY